MSESPSQVTGEPGRPRRAEVLSEAKKNEPGRPRRAEVLSEAKKNEPGRPRRAEVLSEAKKNEPGRPRRAEVLSEAKDKISSSQRDEAQRAQDQISPDLIRSDLTLTPSGKSDTACSNHILSFGEDQTEEDEGQKSEEQKEHQQEDTSSSSDNGIVPCHICAYEVTNEQYAVECDSCCEWYHALCLEQNHNLPYNKVLPCENVYVAHSDKLFQLLDSKQVFNEGFPFVCKTCNVDNLPLPVSLYNKHFFNTKQMIQIDSWPSEFDLNEYLTVYNQRVENEIKDGERSVMEGKVEGVPGSTQKEPVGGQGGSTQKEPVTIGSSHVYIPQNCDASPSSNLFHDHLRGLSDDGIQAELLRTTPFEWREENVLARERLAKVESMKSRRENAGIKAPVPLNRGEEIGRIDVTEGRSPLNPHVVEFPPGDALPNEASSAGYSKGLKVDRKGVEAPQVQAKPPPEKSNQRVTIQQATGTESTQVNQNTQSVSKDSSASLIQIFLQQINEQQRAQAEREERMRKEEREVQLEREQRMYEQMSLFMQNNNNHNNTVPTKKKSLVKMPTLEIPEFHGNWTKWPEFWQLWYDVYHTEEQLTPVQKFRYLLRYVKGEAHKVIEHIPIVNENYQVVIDMLKEKYDNPEKIADIHVTSLQALPSILRINTKELRTFYENMEKHLRNLQHGEPNFELKYGYLIKLLMAKLPIIIQDKMLTQHGDQIKKSINKFREALCQILKTQDKLEFDPKPKPERRPNLQSVEVRGKENREMQELQRQMQQLLQIQQTQQAPQVTQLANPRMNPTMNPGYVRRPKECRFCKTPHATTWCSKVTSLAERRKILEDRKICTNCLGFHKSKCSFARTQCFICKETHVAALCPNHDFTKPPPDSLRRTYQPYNTPKNQNTRRPGTVVSGQIQYKDIPGQFINRKIDKELEDQEIRPVHSGLIQGECDPHANCSVLEFPKGQGETMMQIAVVTIRSPNPPYSTKQVTTLVDTGASNTYLTTSTAREIGTELWGAERCPIASFASEEPTWIQKYQVKFDILLKIPPEHARRDENLNFKTIHAHAVRQICPLIDVPGIKLSEPEVKLLRNMSHELADPDFNKSRRLRIDMLLANDYYPYLLKHESFQLQESKIFLIKTALGWVSAGKISEASLKDQIRSASLLSTTEVAQMKPINESDTLEVPTKEIPVEIEDDKFILDLEETWRKEMLDHRASSVVSAEEDQKAEEIVEKAICIKNGRVSVAWPYKEGLDIRLKPNYYLALRRLTSSLRRLACTPELLMKYHDYFLELLKRGIIEEVLPDTPVGPRRYYIPHHAVFTPMKTTTKMRIVFDASSHESLDSLSLNECLYRGPVYLPSIIGVLFRFRTKLIAIVSDIEKAFLMVDLQISDRDVTRFLWIQDPTNPSAENNLKVYRFTRVPFGVNTSPFLLSFSVRYLLKKNWSPVAELIQANIYVDNVIVAVDSLEKAKEFYAESKAIFNSGKMNLREWGSNSKELMASIPEQDHAKELDVIKVLGVSWKTGKDTFFPEGPEVETLQKATSKRQILKYIQRIFDPMGLAHPITIMGKIFLQKVWKRDYKWDQTLSPELQAQWNHIASLYGQLYSLEIPRLMFSGNITSAQLLCFTDASPDAYTAVIYLRIQTEINCTCDLLYSKARVCPTAKGPSVPRLELQGLVIGLEMVSAVIKELTFQLEAVHVFTDSSCVLRWTSYEQEQRERLTIFVANRLRKSLQIMSILPNPIIRYITSQDNPADLATKLRSETYKTPWQFWLHGPEWVVKPTEDWPRTNLDEELTPEETETMKAESKKGILKVTTGLIQTPGRFENPVSLQNIITIEKYRDLFKVYRITAYVRRFVQKLKGKIGKRIYKEQTDGPTVSGPEIRIAKRLWDQSIQWEHYSDILNDNMSASHQNLARQLNLYIETNTGLIKGRGRLANSKHVQATKLIPHQSHLTYLIVRSYHECLHHASATHTLAILRKEYWVPQLKRLVNKVIADCMICRKIRATPYRLPQMANLPETRVNQVVPFQNIGIDHFGPFNYRGFDGKARKVWVVLFTCQVIRAVHLEVVSDMTAECFLLAFRRFVARRGKPKNVISDNAKYYKAAKEILRMAHEQAIKTNQLFADISWQFIPEFSPWFGGFWERMVKSIKDPIKRFWERMVKSIKDPIKLVLGKGSFSAEQFQTLLSEIEQIVNSRPLMPKGESGADQEHMLSPQDFLTLNPSSSMPVLEADDPKDPEYFPRMDPKTKILQKWKQGNHLLNQFWNIWKTEYLSFLRDCHRTQVHRGPHRASKAIPEVGEVVLLKDHTLMRNEWRIARICRLLPSRDGHARSAEIWVPPRGDKQGVTLIRPISALSPLELDTFKA